MGPGAHGFQGREGVCGGVLVPAPTLGGELLSIFTRCPQPGPSQTNMAAPRVQFQVLPLSGIPTMFSFRSPQTGFVLFSFSAESLLLSCVCVLNVGFRALHDHHW